MTLHEMMYDKIIKELHKNYQKETDPSKKVRMAHLLVAASKHNLLREPNDTIQVKSK